MPKQTNGSQSDLQLIRLRQVLMLVPFSRTTVYRLVSQGDFPSPIKIGHGSSAWLRSEVELWIENCINDSRKGGAL